jgi:hypothetical protein
MPLFVSMTPQARACTIKLRVPRPSPDGSIQFVATSYPWNAAKANDVSLNSVLASPKPSCLAIETCESTISKVSMVLLS